MEVTPAEIGQPERRSVRRRLVQSTLFPHKPEEPEDNGDRKDEKDFVDDDEYYGNERRKKRKAKTKPVSPAKVSKKLSKEKQSTNLTPKKSILSKLNGDTSPSMPDLRLEAKMTAEENSRMFAGKQQHPFFSSLRTGKKSQEANAMVDDCYPAKRKNKGISCGPIHVFESTEDEVIYLDWRNWVLTEDNGVTSGSHGLESNFTSIFYRSCKSLSLDELPTVSHPCEAFFIQDRCLDQSVVEQEHTHHISPPVSSMDADSRVTSVLLLDGTELDCKHYRVSEHSDCEAVWNIKCQSILQERMRPTKDGVWTHEYRPKKATEVCGNRDSVKFLNEWLRLWYERNSQTSKDFTGRDKCDMQDNDLYCTHNASDSESTEEEDSLKNVLLLTGPAGSGKSAAIYACAKDQGFRVSEVTEFLYHFHQTVVDFVHSPLIAPTSCNHHKVPPSLEPIEGGLPQPKAEWPSDQQLCIGKRSWRHDYRGLQTIL